MLAAGHGASDPGAEFGRFKERDEAIVIVDRMAADLRARGVTVEIAPHEEDTQDSIRFVNERFGFGDAWVLEIHRDSASGLDPDDASLRCGIFYGPSEGSRQVGEFMRGTYIGRGAHSKSWARADTESRFGRLGWIRQTRPAAHLLELGFMEGRNDDAHLDRLAKIAAAAVHEAFTGETTAVLPAPTPGSRPVPEPSVTPMRSSPTSHLRSRLFAGNADGSPRSNGDRPGSIDRPHGQLHTAKKNPVDGSDFNAEVVPYIVLPGPASHGNFASDFGVKDRDLAVVICQGQITPAFFGEVGPPFRLGEASIQVHENLVPAVRFPWTTPSKTSIRNASVEGGVLYFVFPGTAVVKAAGMSADEWLEATLKAANDRFEAFLASAGSA